MRIVITIGGSKYDVFVAFANAFGDAFKTLGHDVFIINFSAPDLQTQLPQAFGVKPDFIFAVNSTGSDLFHSLFNKLDTSFFAFMVDNPVYHFDRLNGKIARHIVSYVDRSYLRFHRQYLPKNIPCVFLPHGGFAPANETEEINLEERPIPVLFTGSYWDPAQYESILNQMPQHAAEITRETMDLVLARDNLPMDLALEATLQKKGITNANRDELGKLLILISNYIRAHRRLECIKACTKSDFKVHVYGHHWNQSPLKDKLVIHPSVNIYESLELMRQSKIVLNISAVVPDGSHERIYSSMLHGAVAMTDQNDYLLSHLDHEKDALFYSWQNLETIPDTLNNLLNEPEKLQTIADAGKKNAQDNHTWTHRARLVADGIN